jgi:YHS domain-containing protein
VQDPQIQLQELGITIPDLIDPKRLAVLDATHRTFVNFETFFFASEDDKRRFDADPTGSCGILTDPVTKTRFRPSHGSPRGSYADRLYVFLDEASRAAFDRDPEAFARPNYDKLVIPGMPMPR